MTENDNGFLETALRFISMGCRAVILGKKSKETVTAHTPNGLNDATLDPATARAWWEVTPKCNVGVVCGETAEDGRYLTVIDWDVDDEKGVDAIADVLTPWEREHGELPETVTEITGRGGMHHFYWTDRPVPKHENHEMHVDIRGVGSYAMAAPSIHPNGNEVQWDNHPDDYDIAWADDNVYALIDKVLGSKPKEGGRREKVRLPKKKIREGEGRNTFLYEQGCSLRGSRDDADDEYIAAWLTTLNMMHCDPPVSQHELDKVIGSVCKLPIGMSDEVREKLAKREQGGTVPKNRTAQHVMVARRLLDLHSACFLDGAPAVFDGLTYRIGWDSVERVILGEWPNARDRDRKEVVKYLNLVMPHETQSDPRYIGFANGVLDVETMELLSFSPSFRIPNVIPHDWNPDARSETLDRTIRKIACGDPFVEHNLFEFIGLCMYRSGQYAHSAILLGRKTEKASNGKSTYINLLKNVLGKDNFSSMSLCDFGEKFNRQFLAGKLANLGDDISSEFTKGASLEVFKKAVSGEEIHTDVKNGKGYDFVPYCTVVLSANDFPKMENLDDGVLRRMHPIRFNAHFTKDDPDFDPSIKRVFKYDDGVAEAAIVRGVWGLRRVMEQQGPTENDESRRMVRDIKTDNNSILQWIEDEGIERDHFVEYTVGGAFEMYEKWCTRSGVRNYFAKWQFSKKMCEHFKFVVKNTSRNGGSVRIFVNA